MTFIAPDGATIYDICLNTYQTLNLLLKLMTDNGINGVNDTIDAGTVFTFDETLVKNLQTKNYKVKYATK